MITQKVRYKHYVNESPIKGQGLRLLYVKKNA